MNFDKYDIERILGKKKPEKRYSAYPEVRGRVVLVTGAGGFIASELCMEIAGLEPSALLLIEQTEHSLYEVHRKLIESYPDLKVVPILSSCGDADYMTEVMIDFEVETVFHVAAYKHVPMCERNPISAIKNNVLGAMQFFIACRKAEVSELLVVSSDKAVNPTNIMGASKRLVEYLALARPRYVEETRVVRFGNVMWSSGSVLPLFAEQIERKMPITVTHEEVNRYFMTVQQAVVLILDSMHLESGMYCFDMGEPVRILDIALRMAKEYGSEGGIRIVGLRPGEKLYEELTLGENLGKTEHPCILRVDEKIPSRESVQMIMGLLRFHTDRNNTTGLRKSLKKTVPGYDPMGEIVDDLWISRLDDCYQIPEIK